MVIGLIGESCSGKSTLASAIQQRIGGEIVTGKDYLRMAKSEGEAKNLFQKKLRDAVRGGHVIYVISEEEYLPLLPDGAVRVLVKADLDTIKERFRARMRENLPAPVEKMPERNHGRFDGIACDFSYDASCANPDDLCARILEKAGQDSSGV